MKKIIIFHASVFLIILSIFISCKGPEGEIGPAGDPGRDFDLNNLWTSKEGFMKGTATGTQFDGTDFTYNLDFEGNITSSSNYYRSATGTVINVEKLYSGEGDLFNTGYINLMFSVPDMETLGAPALDSFGVIIEKNLGANMVHRVQLSPALGGSATVSGLAYDAIAGVLTGNYTLTLDAGPNNGSFSVSDGTFSTKLTQVVPRRAAQE